ncbi:hypothetical protein CP500_009425 [Tychonema bourrellyi FEM_GT703]|uniref:Nuclear transport factor 2 family protein n=2 Tax=Tychonema bourrellyi TaxID=54313 RepID=A0A2G4F1U4_9CYAN|nr:hypothetical protein CP500_009425 [Tychonema bourrellyi FEM_GT703]
MLSLNIKVLTTTFPLGVLSLFLSSYAASTNPSQPPYNLLNFNSIETNTSPIKPKQNLLVADINSEKISIKSIVLLQIKALNEENIEAYMSTIDPGYRGFEVTKNIQLQIFSQYDLKYVINQFDVISLSSNTAVIRVDQTTTKIRGPQFRNNRLVLIHNLNKSNGQWKMFSSEVQKIEYLN